MMRILVCGSRTWEDRPTIERAMHLLHATQGISQVIEGGATGADSIAKSVALAMGIPVTTIHAQWAKYGKAAGPLRNQAMLQWNPDLVLAFHENILKSKGTKDMVRQAGKANILVKIINDTSV